MDVVAWSLFVPACFAINMAPGPNNLLSVRNAARFGLGCSTLAAGGRLAAFALMVVLVAFGLGALLAASEHAFAVIKLLGAAYLVYVGVRMIVSRLDPEALGGNATPDMTGMMREELLLAIGNPKAAATFIGLFPQFVNLSAASSPQLLRMGAVFMALECIAIVVYGVAGLLARGALSRGSGVLLLNKGVGAFFVISAVWIAFHAL